MSQSPADAPDENLDEAAGADRVDTRAELLPEEVAAGSDEPVDQARVILEESDERTLDPEGTRHDYQQTPDRPGQDARPD